MNTDRSMREARNYHKVTFLPFQNP